MQNQDPGHDLPDGPRSLPGHRLPVAGHDRHAWYIPRKHVPILTFSQPFRASGFYDHLRQQAPDLNIEWYRTGLRRYQVVLLYSDKKSLQVGKARLKRLGVAFK